MDADYLTNLVRFMGVVVALVASFLAARDATRHPLWAPIRREVAATGRTIAEEVRRANLRLRGRGRDRGRVVQLSGTASLGVGASVTASGTLTLTVDPDASVRDRVERLEQHVASLEALHEQNKQAVAKEAADRQEAVRRVTSESSRKRPPSVARSRRWSAAHSSWTPERSPSSSSASC